MKQEDGQKGKFMVLVSCRQGESPQVIVDEGVNWLKAGWDVIRYRFSGLDARAVRLGVEPEARRG